MFEKIPYILKPDEILDKCFKKANKKTVHDRDPSYRRKKTIIARTDSFANSLINELEKYVKKFPSLNQLPYFYQEIINIKIGTDKLKKSLGAIDWARKKCKKIYLTNKKTLKKYEEEDFLEKKQKEIYGRFSSIIKQIKDELNLLRETSAMMRKTPDIRDIPTIVIAGYPNVGKSCLLRALTSAKPKIAKYPFTTKEIHVGHIKKEEKYKKTVFQVIDTPGLLDRAIEERNKIEQQAIAALTHLAEITIFIFDPSTTCGYSLQQQKNLFENMKKMFSKSYFIVVENKCDIEETNSSNLKISCEKNINIEVLRKKIFKTYEKKIDKEKDKENKKK
ncbi:MAG: GTPase [Candidatus Thermoplasmatota archaeon]